MAVKKEGSDFIVSARAEPTDDYRQCTSYSAAANLQGHKKSTLSDLTTCNPFIRSRDTLALKDFTCLPDSFTTTTLAPS